MVRKKKVYTLEKFLGVNEMCDYSSSFSSEARIIKNYRVTGDYSLKKRGGFSHILTHHNEEVSTLWNIRKDGKQYLLYISGDILYKYNINDDIWNSIGIVGYGKATMFQFGEYVYILNGTNYYRYDWNVLDVVEGYIPKVIINSTSDGKGIAFEDRNILTGKVSQLYNGDSTSSVYRLGSKGELGVERVEVEGRSVDFSYDSVTSTITLSSPPTHGSNNVAIIAEYPFINRQKIVGCNGAVFCGGGNDTRLMVWGNSEYNEYCFYSELADGVSNVEYFPEINSIKLSGHEISDIVRHYDRQIIFTNKGAFYSYDSTITDSLGNVRSVFPVFTLSSQKGNLASRQVVVIDNYPVTLWHDGIYKWVSTNIRDERNTKLISERVSESFARMMLTPEQSNCLMLDCENRGELWIVANGEAIIFNYRLDLWYVYDNMHFTSLEAVGDEVWFGTADGKIGKFSDDLTSDNGRAIGCFWITPFMTFGDTPTKKELRELVMLHGDKDDKTDIHWSTDDQRGDTAPFHTGFESVGLGPVVEEVRLGIKHFNAIKLTFKSDTVTSGSHIVSISLGVKR